MCKITEEILIKISVDSKACTDIFQQPQPTFERRSSGKILTHIRINTPKNSTNSSDYFKIEELSDPLKVPSAAAPHCAERFNNTSVLRVGTTSPFLNGSTRLSRR